jgi:hypothetical protein
MLVQALREAQAMAEHYKERAGSRVARMWLDKWDKEFKEGF